MKFLNVYCEVRKADVLINLDKIVLITKLDEGKSCGIELDGSESGPVKVAMPADDLIRKINGEDRMGIGFHRRE